MRKKILKKINSKNILINFKVNKWDFDFINQMLQQMKINKLGNNQSDLMRWLIGFCRSYPSFFMLYMRDFKSMQHDKKLFIQYCLSSIDKINQKDVEKGYF